MTKPKIPDTAAPTPEDDIISNLLENLPSTDLVEIKVPSKNKFYSLLDSSKGIMIKCLTFAEEKELITRTGAGGDVLNTLLEKCVSNINIKDILQLDKLFIIMKIREISYGNAYKASVTCPACKEENNLSVNLSELNTIYMEDDVTDPVTITLPVLKKTVKVRLPRISDEAYLATNEKTLINLWRFVEDIEGHTKKTLISKVIGQLPLRDAHTILGALSGDGVGIETNVRFICNYCEHSEVLGLPITGDFFTGN
tara:strand:- start:390 stop:1151 length:762 start_codon:yes stop_codon:yes gene_type:complete